ncbi:hypothetical protein [Paenibacillus humicola]|uniref:hypothetical protein n=1 Tax=Paenibacillus humicola TaxID=3110540 RepID=UPI00237B03EA|nr:hypothetical protein [Paenibacillus humicola]
MDQAKVAGKELLDVEWVALIMFARKMGFGIEEIRNTLSELQSSTSADGKTAEEAV